MRLRSAATAIALLGTGCGTALNYLDPSGPMYEIRQAAPSAAAPPRTMRVVTFNIENAVHIDRAIDVLRETQSLQGLDLLALQEMDAPGVEKIAEALRLNSLYIPSAVTPKTNHDIGCALLSPWPLLEPRKIMLPHGARGTGLRRVAVVATMLRGNKRIRVYAVHLPAPFGVSGDALRDEVDTLLADADASPDPVVIAGDLNSHGLGESFVKRGYAWLTRDVGASVSEMAIFKLAFDHVFTKGMAPIAPGPAAGVVRDNKKASDHHPVWALVDTGGEPEATRAAPQ